MTAGYTPTEARAIAADIDRAARNVKVQAYREYAAETRACGCKPETLSQYLGEEKTGKAAASERLSSVPFYELDMY